MGVPTTPSAGDKSVPLPLASLAVAAIIIQVVALAFRFVWLGAVALAAFAALIWLSFRSLLQARADTRVARAAVARRERGVADDEGGLRPEVLGCGHPR